MRRFGASSIDELRKIDAEILVAATDVNHHITVDGYVLKELPYDSYRKGIHNEEACLQGFNALEGTPFILFAQANMKNYEQKVRTYFGDYSDEILKLYPASTDGEAKAMWTDIYSGVYFTYGHYCWSRQAIANGFPAYEYFFTKENGRLGTWHSGEEVYCYNNIPAASRLYDESDRELADQFSDYFVNFIRSGDPNGEGLPVWEPSATGTEVMELGIEQGMRTDKFFPLHEIFDRFYGWEA